jgi:hypothetical protein
MSLLAIGQFRWTSMSSLMAICYSSSNEVKLEWFSQIFVKPATPVDAPFTISAVMDMTERLEAHRLFCVRLTTGRKLMAVCATIPWQQPYTELLPSLSCSADSKQAEAVNSPPACVLPFVHPHIRYRQDKHPRISGVWTLASCKTFG